jgi:hypothetical protein
MFFDHEQQGALTRDEWVLYQKAIAEDLERRGASPRETANVLARLPFRTTLGEVRTAIELVLKEHDFGSYAGDEADWIELQARNDARGAGWYVEEERRREGP